MNRLRLYSTIAALGVGVSVFVAGCGTGGNTAAPAGNTSNANTSGTTTAVTGDAQQGLKLFQQDCSMCHSTGTNRVVGPGLKGIMSKSQLPNGQPVNNDNVQNWIRTGGGGMPGFPQLTDQQRADLVAYLSTLS
ncbi:c-type cytochrome [Alicyclobacillus ferrooxydans]|uniref:c-type cytochrome n=1 Tax=Alicyclobacillus ferrooxydans TaxID=471514 RepID=UPI0006D58D39|nr:cytochrome c [Alicyclobacillus ferrooxydans]